MSTNMMMQSLEDQFLHWRQDMESKREEQARQMKELQAHAERLQQENDQLWTQIEKNRYLGKDVPNNGRSVHPITRNRGKEPIVLDNVDTSTNDELFSGKYLPLSLS